MLNKLKKDNRQGFTIIEVMIVLAIAGLILLIVFLAVPALQRNARNTQRKNDVAAVLAAVSEFTNNNSGSLPSGTWTNTGGTLTLQGATGSGAASSQAKVGYYTGGVGQAADDVYYATPGTIASGFTTSAKDYVEVAFGTVCNGNAPVAGSARSVTAVYEIESGSGTYAEQCQGS